MRTDPRRARRAVVAGLLTTFLATVGAGADAQEASDERTVWTAALEAEAEGAWITSNAAYQAEDGGIERYGLDWTVVPGGMVGTACLWGERAGERTVFWRFLRFWDPIEGRGVVHQSSPSGAVALGSRPAGSDELVQTLVQPDGSRLEIRHRTELEGDSVRIDRSWQRPPGAGAWTEGRTYRWQRHGGLESPCGAG